MEIGPVEEVFDNPQHDYTKALLDAVLEPDPASRHIKPKISLNSNNPEEIMEVGR